jgi:hypothetical protein
MAILPTEHKNKILASNTKTRCGEIIKHGTHQYIYKNDSKFSSNGI